MNFEKLYIEKRTFENNFPLAGALCFGRAMRCLKLGDRIARAEWAAAGDSWVCLGAGNSAVRAADLWNQHVRQVAMNNGGMAEVLPYLVMKTADDKIQMGWTPSQADMLAEDWLVVQ